MRAFFVHIWRFTVIRTTFRGLMTEISSLIFVLIFYHLAIECPYLAIFFHPLVILRYYSRKK